MALGEILERSARAAPQTTAVICGEASITYGELDRSATGLAQRLLEFGLSRGERVAILWANSVEIVTLYFACFKAGLVAVPINIRLKPVEVEYVLRHAAASICFSQPRLLPIAEQALATGGLSMPVYSELPAAGDIQGTLPEIGGSDPAVILYTSGTTAQPKGVLHTHASLTETARLTSMVTAGSAGVGMPTTQVSHMSGLCFLLASIAERQTFVILPAFDPELAVDTMERHRVTCLIALPAMLAMAANAQEQRPRDVSSLQAIFGGGDAVPVALQERANVLFGRSVLEVFALTECCPALWNTKEVCRTGSMGKTGAEARIEDGELVIRSGNTCAGYWNDPEATELVLRAGWLRTGDLARQDEDGYFWFAGRAKQIIIRCGSNISPQEVEAALYQHPSVCESGVIGLPDALMGQTVAAYVSLREGCTASEEELREFARERLADYKVPENIWFLPVLPKGLTGKVDRCALAEMARSFAAGA